VSQVEPRITPGFKLIRASAKLSALRILAFGAKSLDRRPLAAGIDTPRIASAARRTDGVG